MAKKKKLPPPLLPELPTETPLLVSGETENEKLARNIAAMTHIMERVFGCEMMVTPGQLFDTCEMFLATMHLKKVTPEFFMGHMTNATAMMGLAKQIEAEGKVSNVEGIPEAAIKILSGAMEISVREINMLREKMLADVALMKEIPLPGTRLH